MKIILNKNVETLGPVGAVVNVSDGYARNYLIPQGHAKEASKSNIKQIEQMKAKEIKKEKGKKADAEKLAEKIKSISCTLEVNAGEDDKLFGSITAADIHTSLSKEGIEVDKKNILLKSSLRKIGAYQVEVRCYTGVKAPLKVWVVRKKG
jgi:large subunit ribosomal protein L9